MNKKMVNCKICNAEIAESASVCPNCGAKNSKPIHKKWWFWCIVGFVALMILTPGEKEKNKQVEEQVVETSTEAVQKDAEKSEEQAVQEEQEKNQEDDKKTSNSPKISMQEFEAIKTGMTYQQVVDIIGGEGELSSQVDIAGYNTEMYMWKGEGGLGANANVTFQNGKLSSKAQFGLK